MNCADVAERANAWAIGSLSDAEARQLENHAAECATCELLLETAPSLPQLPTSIKPPAGLRGSTLAKVSARRRVLRRRTVGLAAAGIAAAAMIAIAIQPRGKSAQDFPGAGRVLLAMKRAKPEFAELDAAERDLVAALATSPDDAELVSARQRLQHQRELLQRMIDEVNK